MYNGPAIWTEESKQTWNLEMKVFHLQSTKTIKDTQYLKYDLISLHVVTKT